MNKHHVTNEKCNLSHRDIKRKKSISITRQTLSSDEIAPPHAKFVKTRFGNRYGTWVDPVLDQPYFNQETERAFLVDQTARDFLKFKSIKVTQQQLQRLSCDSRQHKKRASEELFTKMTQEDKLNAEDYKFKYSLRTYTASQKADSYRKVDGRSEQDSQQVTKRVFDVGNPPSFYEDDMNRWLNQKFKHVQDQSENLEQYYQTNGHSNVHSAQSQRKRQSVCGFTQVDFAYAGNSEPINHLIKSRPSSVQCLSFNANLRSQQNQSALKHQEPFKVVQIGDRERLKTRRLSQSEPNQQGSALGQQPYADRFADMNTVRVLQKFDSGVPLLKWQLNLREMKEKK